MKKALIFSAVVLGIALVGCSKSNYLGKEIAEAASPIEFFGGATHSTKADIAGDPAAALLHNEFMVLGKKLVGETETVVFDNVAVKYDAQSTAANKWSYLHDGQELRFWDPNASKYTFLAYSDANATKRVVVPTAEAPATFTIGTVEAPVDTEALSKVYTSPAAVVEKANFTSPISFKFSNAAAKVRVAFYDAVPGYKVRVLKFYASSTDQTGSNNVELISDNGFYSKAAYNITMASGKISVISGSTTASSLLTLGDQIVNAQSTNHYIGETIADATFDKAGKAYTWVMPVGAAAKELNLKVYYEMKSGHETIKRTTTVRIPAEFAQWEANHAYTYVFKITDNDLHPITFSATVEDFINEETITTVDGGQDINITTYVAGSDVQGNGEYKKGDLIYVGLTNYDTASEPVIGVLHSEDAELDGSNAAAKTAGQEFETLDRDEDETLYQFKADKAGKYVIKVTYKCLNAEHTDLHTAYKVVKVVE